MAWFTTRQCDPVCCSITAVSKATRSFDSYKLQSGGKQQVGIKSTADSVEGWRWICLPTKLETLSHLDNTVNSNQDAVISNYRPSAARGLGLRCDVMKWQMWAMIYLHRLLPCRRFKPDSDFIGEMYAADRRSSAGDSLPNHWGQEAHHSSESLPMPDPSTHSEGAKIYV